MRSAKGSFSSSSSESSSESDLATAFCFPLPGSARCGDAAVGLDMAEGRGGGALGREGWGGGEEGVMLREAMSAVGGKLGDVGDLDLSVITGWLLARRKRDGRWKRKE